MHKVIYCALALVLISIPASAHLKVGSLKPAGGETHYVDSTITIEWVATQAHDGKYDIYYSTDGGKTFPVELAGPWQGSKTDNAKNLYLWKIPKAAISENVRIRICQLYGGHCVQPGTYMMDSPEDFKILAEKTTGIFQISDLDQNATRLQFLNTNGNFEIKFSLIESQKVSLKAYDVAGNLVAIVADTYLEKGEHRIGLASEVTQAQGPLVFKWMVGDKVISSQIWSNGK
jgi:hypothetical protein